MKTLFVAVVSVLLFVGAAFAKDVYVDGYIKDNGTYVEPYHRTSPDSSSTNNYSSEGNYNPYTGKAGSDSNSYTPKNNSYSSGLGGSTSGNSLGGYSSSDHSDFAPRRK